MKYLLITNMYPKEDALYRNAFVHTRVKNYLEYMPNIEITIFVLVRNTNTINNYTFDSVNVIGGNKGALQNIISELRPNKLLIHFLNYQMMEVIENLNFRMPILIWVHGTEALGWYRRMFNFNQDIKGFLKYILVNTRQLNRFRHFIKRSKGRDVTFIFVSKWMKKVLEADTLSRIDKFKIIPNSVDDKIFKYQPKTIEDRKKVLLIRSFETRKYANDLAIEAILILSKKKFFEDLEFTIYGKGKHFDPLKKKVERFSNVKFHNQFLKHQEIAEVHKKNGVFLCPTRQDSQGVSMCEAMSSGLVPITSNNTAIPEFVKQKETGILTNNAKEIAHAIEYLYNNPIQYLKISKNAANEITKMCQPSFVISEELNLISN